MFPLRFPLILFVLAFSGMVLAVPAAEDVADTTVKSPSDLAVKVDTADDTTDGTPEGAVGGTNPQTIAPPTGDTCRPVATYCEPCKHSCRAKRCKKRTWRRCRARPQRRRCR